ADRRDQGGEPRRAGHGRHRGAGAGVHHVVRRAGAGPARVVEGDRADGGHHRRRVPVHDRGRHPRAGLPLGRGRLRAARSDGCRARAALARGPGAGAGRAVAGGGTGHAGGAGRTRPGRGRERFDAHGREGRGGRRLMATDWLVPLVVVVAVLFASFIKIVPEYERVIIFRLGRRTKALLNPGGQGNGPGLVLLVPFIDKIRQRISLRTLAMDVPPQDVITRDNVSIKVNAVIFF